MSDIIERLQDCIGIGADMYEAEIIEAIAEIDRLRAIVNEQAAAIVQLDADNVKLNREIERLRNEIALLRALVDRDGP